MLPDGKEDTPAVHIYDHETDDTESDDRYGSDPAISVEYDEEFENLVNTLMHDRGAR